MNNTVKTLLSINLLNIFGFSIFAPLYVLFGLGLVDDISKVANSWGLYIALTGVFILVWGKIEDKFNLIQLKVAVVIGYTLLALGALAFFVVDNFLTLNLVLVLNALGSGLTAPAWKSLFSKVEDRGKEASEWSYFDGGGKILTAVGVVIGGVLLERFGFKAIFLVMFGVQLVATFLSLRLLSKA